MKPFITVIIPVFNRKEFILEAIKSVLVQTYKPYEIFVIDDGSSTDIKTFLQPYAHNIKYFYQSNKGLSGARNTGIRNSNGDYIAFLDDDDLYEPYKLEKQVSLLEQDMAIGFVYSDCYEFNDNNPNNVTLNRAVGRDNDPKDFAKLFFLVPNIRVPTVLVRRECFDDVGLFDETLPQHEDGDMFLRIALKWKVKFSNYPSARVRHHPKQMSHDRISMNKSILQSTEKIILKYPEFKKYLGLVADKRIVEIKRKLIENLIIRKQFKEAENISLDLCFNLKICTRLSLLIKSAIPLILEKKLLNLLNSLLK